MPVDLPDWSDPATLSAPHDAYQTLLDGARVSFSPAVGGWIVAGYDEVTELLFDERLSAAGPQGFMAMLPDEARAELEPLRNFFAHWMVFSDEPYHSDVKNRLTRAWSGRRVEAWRPLVQQAIAAQLAGLGDGVVDAVDDLARPLSNRIIGEILGIPEEDRAMMDGWSADIIGFIVTPQPDWDRGRRAQVAAGALEAYAWEMATRQPEHMLAPLAPLGRVAVAATMAQLLTGGIDPLTAALASLMHQVVEGQLPPGRKSDPAGTRQDVEESLRLSCPFTLAPRLAREDIVLAGRPVPAGEMINLLMAAANRDPLRYAEPDRFLPRPAGMSQQLAFGLGAHYCLGAGLARIVLTEFAAQLSCPHQAFAPAGAPEWIPAFGIRMPVRLPVRRVRA
jgi:cytochrome P450